MSEPFLSIAIPVYDDYPGLWATVQDLQVHHAERLDECELLVVDNHPDSQDGLATKRFCGRVDARYIPMPEPVGCAPPKNRCFAEARGEFVLAIDAHVIFEPNVLAYVIGCLRLYESSRDLFTGPLVYDDGESVATHWVDGWNNEMWGRWADKPDPRGDLVPLPPDLSAGDISTEHWPTPFEVPANICALTLCRKDAWPGLNAKFRGFGMQQIYLSEKFRRRGDKTLCLPWLRWRHRFAEGITQPYPFNTSWCRARNCILARAELGLPLEPVRQHFVDELKKLTAEQWDELAAVPDDPPMQASPHWTRGK